MSHSKARLYEKRFNAQSHPLCAAVGRLAAWLYALCVVAGHLVRSVVSRLAQVATAITLSGVIAAACTASVFIAAQMLPGQAEVAFAKTETFALLADTHLGLPGNPVYNDVEKALLWAANQPKLCAVCDTGDVTDRGDAVAFSEWEFLCDSITGKVARIQALGDHDTGKNGEYLSVDRTLTVANGLRHFKEVNGGTVMSFRTFSNANVITFGGVRASGSPVVTESMLAQLNRRLLKTVRQGKIAIVICHYPYNSAVLNMHAQLMGVLRSFPNVIYVSGHRHRYAASQQCRIVQPAYSKTRYSRTGADRSHVYPFVSVGVDACSTYRGGGTIHADSLSVFDSGAIRLKKWNVSTNRMDATWLLRQTRSSVSVRCVGRSSTGASKASTSAFRFRITFSDGGTYSGVKSGSTFSLKAGARKQFTNIPAGVLVKVETVKVPRGWSKPPARAVEVTDSTRTLTMQATAASSKQKANGLLKATR